MIEELKQHCKNQLDRKLPAHELLKYSLILGLIEENELLKKQLQNTALNIEYKQCQHVLNTIDDPKLAICMKCGQEYAVAY